MDGGGGAFIIIIFVFVKRGVFCYFFANQSEGTINLRTFAWLVGCHVHTKETMQYGCVQERTMVGGNRARDGEYILHNQLGMWRGQQQDLYHEHPPFFSLKNNFFS
jgi:hypothetical protein